MQVARQGSGRRRSSRSSRKVSISVRVYSTLNPNPAPSRPFSPRVSSRPAPLGSRWGQRKPYDVQSGQPCAFTIAPAPAFSDPRTRLHPSFPGPPRVNSPRETRERAHRVTRQRSERRDERREMGAPAGGFDTSKVWSPAGGWFADPKHWKRNTAMGFGVLAVASAMIFNYSRKLETRPLSPTRRIPSQAWCKNFPEDAPQK